MLPVDEVAFKPNLSFLSQEDKEKIHRTVLKILSEIGMKVNHAEALNLLTDAGCSVQDDGMVKIAEELVLKSIDSAPENIAIYDREANHVMDLGGHRSYYGTGSDLIYSLESETMQRHRCVLEDVARAARVADAMPNLDFIMSFAHPSDIPAAQAYLHSFQAMATNSANLPYCAEITAVNRRTNDGFDRILRNGEEELRAKPYCIYYGEPVSPLQHAVESVDKLLFCAGE